MKCEQLENCAFFKTLAGNESSGIAAQLKALYCEDNPLLCARRRVARALGREKVPENLHPDHIHHALDLIACRHGEA